MGIEPAKGVKQAFRLRSVVSLVCPLSLAVGSAAQVPEYVDHALLFQRLTSDVTSLKSLGDSGTIICAGPDAFTICSGQSDGTQASTAAASFMGQGLVIAIGDPDALTSKGLAVGDWLSLIKNASKARLKEQRKARVAVYQAPELARALEADGVLVKEFKGPEWTASLNLFDCVVTAADFLGNGNDVKRLVEFVRGGGVFIGATHGREWEQKYVKNRLKIYPNSHYNSIFMPAGLAVGPKSATGSHLVKADEIGMNSCQVAIAKLIEHRDRVTKLTIRELTYYSGVVMEAISNLPPFDQTVRAKVDVIIGNVSDAVEATPSKPLNVDDPWTRIAVQLLFEDSKKILPDEMVSDPAARLFPGLVPKATPKIIKKVVVLPGVIGPQSTGLWINAGDRVTLTLPASAIKSGLAVQIGSHSSELWAEPQWKRYPSVVRTFELNKESLRVRSEFGGLVYVRTTTPLAVPIAVQIEGCAEAQQFVLGESSNKEWRNPRANIVAPWAEIIAGRVLLTLPLAQAKNISDPEAFAKRLSDDVAAFVALSRRLPLPNLHSVVVDVQASSAQSRDRWHSALTEAQVAALADPKQTDVAISALKEIARAYQVREWTFDGSQDVTNRVFALYAMDTVHKVPPKVASGYDPYRVSKYLAEGAKFETWKADPELATMMYVQLIETFGWDAFKKTFQEYRDLTPEFSPTSDDSKRDHWVVRFSRNVGRDLTPFFAAWGFPFSQEARAAVTGLPQWRHPDLRTSVARPGRS